MADQHYDLFFNGQIEDGFYDDFVKADLKTLFKTDDAYIEKLFSGQVQVIKRQVDKATAIRFQQAFKKAGAKLIVKQHNADSQNATSAKPTAPQKPVQPQTKTAAPNQSALSTSLSDTPGRGENDDSLVEHHQPDLSAPDSVPDWDLSAPGALLSQTNDLPTADIDTRDLTLAEPGAALIDQTDAPVVSPVSTDHLSVAPPGTDLDTLDDKPEPVHVDISHLSVKP